MTLGFGFSVIDNIIDYSPVEGVRLSQDAAFVIEEDLSCRVKNVAYEFKIGDRWHDFESLSDGTKRLIYIILSIDLPRPMLVDADKSVELRSGSIQKVILLEEPEIGIHPHQLYQLLQFLRAQSRKHQVIITTHSPLVLDMLGRDELDRIVIASYDNKLGSIFKHLSEDQRSTALDYMTETGFLSDYWRYSDLEPRAILW